MKIGSFVAVQFDRPLYLFTYGASVVESGDKDNLLIPSPITEPACSMGEAEQFIAAGQHPPMKDVARDYCIAKLVDANEQIIVLELSVPRDAETVVVIRKSVFTKYVIGVDYVLSEVAPAPNVCRAVPVKAQSAASRVTLK